MTEIWKPCRDFEDLYEVSNLGRVRRVRPFHKTLAGKIMRGSINRYGYRTVRLSNRQTRKHKCIHQLVCEAFHGPRPSPIHQAAHRNDDKNDNRAISLYWATPEQNYADRDRNGKTYRGSQIALSKLNEKDIPIIRNRVANGISPIDLAKHYKVHPLTIERVITGRCWRHVPQTETRSSNTEG